MGKGSFGVVYEAVKREFSIESRAAIKVISIPLDNSDVDNLVAEGMTPEGIESYYKSVVNEFTKEIAILASFKGAQNIVGVDDYKVIKRNPYGWYILIRMELLTPLNTYFKHYERNESTVLKLGMDICSALEYCNVRSVVHRDIKPDNIFANSFGDFILGDFGVAKSNVAMTNNMSQKGTYNYMAPEVQKGEKYNGTIDIYSLGLVLYRLLNKNQLPFIDMGKQITHNDRVKALRRRLSGEDIKPPCDASPEMAEIILKACAYKPQDRYKSATEMKRDLVLLKEKLYPGLSRAKPVREELSEPSSLIDRVNKRVAANATGSVNVYATPTDKANTNDTGDSSSWIEFGDEKSRATDNVTATPVPFTQTPAPLSSTPMPLSRTPAGLGRTPYEFNMTPVNGMVNTNDKITVPATWSSAPAPAAQLQYPVQQRINQDIKVAPVASEAPTKKNNTMLIASLIAAVALLLVIILILILNS